MAKILFLIVWLIFSNVSAETIIIGTSSENPPFSFQVSNQNHFYGFEVELMSNICYRIGVQCQFKSVGVSSIIDELNSGKIDYAIAAIMLPDKPLKGFVFSLPYLQSGAQFMTLVNSKINAPADIRGKTIGVRKGTLGGGTLFKNLIMEIYDEQLKVLEYPTMPDLLYALNKEEVDAIFSNALPIRYWYYNHKTIYKLVGSRIPFGNSYSIMGRKKSQLQMMQINHALLDTMGDGSYLKIYNRYFSWIPE